MTIPGRTTIRRTLTALVAVMVAVSAFGLVAPVSADPTAVSVTQTTSATTVAQGGEVTFTVDVDATDNNAPAL
jgi:hypothetical protein